MYTVAISKTCRINFTHWRFEGDGTLIVALTLCSVALLVTTENCLDLLNVIHFQHNCIIRFSFTFVVSFSKYLSHNQKNHAFVHGYFIIPERVRNWHVQVCTYRIISEIVNWLCSFVITCYWLILSSKTFFCNLHNLQQSECLTYFCIG